MKETAVQVNQRQIQNGIRKQAEAVQREKDKVWDKLTEVKKPANLADIQVVRRAVSASTRKLHAKWTIETEEIAGINASKNE